MVLVDFMILLFLVMIVVNGCDGVLGRRMEVVIVWVRVVSVDVFFNRVLLVNISVLLSRNFWRFEG